MVFIPEGVGFNLQAPPIQVSAAELPERTKTCNISLICVPTCSGGGLRNVAFTDCRISFAHCRETLHSGPLRLSREISESPGKLNHSLKAENPEPEGEPERSAGHMVTGERCGSLAFSQWLFQPGADLLCPIGFQNGT
ncbi:hypothetical protein CHARACLAT_032317 [Characodon lateralis]|uniref:Uncharacterized protein n=1 Tax=Characodon lateralis TaxID=208331 RepID=A0ABU7DFK4_9TELE|nr:hypothetical protein [Characodon lateralis]